MSEASRARPDELVRNLLRLRMGTIHARLTGLEGVPDTDEYRRLHDFVCVHEALVPPGHLHEGEIECRPVPARRHFGDFRWYDPGRGVIVGAYWPSFHPRASSIALAFPLPLYRDPVDRVGALGLPVPDADPTIVIGDVAREEGTTWIFAPAPEHLAELVYRIRRTRDGWDVIATAERPPEPRYEQLVGELQRAFGWSGTLRFPSGRDFREKNGELEPPGSFRLDHVA